MQQGLTSDLADELRSRVSQKPPAKSQWDIEASPAGAPGNSGVLESAHSFSDTSAADRPLDAPSVSSGPILTKRQELMSELVDSSLSRVSGKIDARSLRDSKTSPTAAPSSSNGLESDERQVALSTGVEAQRDAHSTSISPVTPLQQASTNGLQTSPATTEAPVKPSWSDVAAVDEVRSSRELTTTEMREADEALYQLFSPKNLEVVEEQKTSNKKWVVVAAVGACSILVLSVLMFLLFHHGTRTIAKQSVQPATTYVQPEAYTPEPQTNQPGTQTKPSAATANQTTTNGLSAGEEQAVNSGQPLTSSQTKMMNDQLAAPTRIPRNAQNQAGENDPPPASLGMAAADGLGGGSANSGVFSSHAQPVVKAAPSKPITISAGVAVGMLIYQTAPIYPQIAKAARVSGTVQLQATISKQGTISDLRVVSGPAMLRQAAVDAVKAWRYKPYKLNNEPTEVDTTINVNFSLGG